MRILGICGSLRTGSSNRKILEAVGSLGEPSVELKIFESLADLPFYNPDLDRAPLPTAVDRFRGAVASSDALLISTPEYAHGIPGVLKNALDWLVSDEQFGGKPVGVAMGSASSGTFAETALIEVLKTMSARLPNGAIMSIPGSRVQFDRSGQPRDTQVLQALKSLVIALGT